MDDDPADVRRFLAELDHRDDPLVRWRRQRPIDERAERERRERESKERLVTQQRQHHQANNEWWSAHDERVLELINLYLWEPPDGHDYSPFVDTLGQVVAGTREFCHEQVAEGTKKVEERVGELETLFWTKLIDKKPEEAIGKIAALKQELADTKRELADARRELIEGAAKVQEGLAELEDAFWGRRESDEKRHAELAGKAAERIASLERELGDARCELADTKRELVAIRHELKAAADVDERFRQLERSMAARQAAVEEAKRGSEIQQSDLPAGIEGLQRQLDELKRVAAQPGPQGPPGKDGKLPIVKVFQKDTVYYTGDVAIFDGSTYQALRDTGQNVNHADWVCLARAGRDGLTPTIRGTYDAYGRYKKLDIVALDGASFIAKRDNPGLCPGDGWQLLSRQGKPGRRGESITGPRGEKGDKGERGEPGATIVAWQLDRERYCVSPLMSDGEAGPVLELRGLFEQFLNETGS